MKDNINNSSQLLIEENDGINTASEELVFRKPKKFVKKKRALTVLIILLALLLLAGLSFAGFKLFGPGEVYDDSTAFYFTGDLVSEEGGEYTVYDRIEFNVYNYADSLRVSKEPLESFIVKVECDGKDITSKSNISMGETAMAADVRSGCAVSVKVPEQYNGSVIDIKVTSYPINKELRGSFKVLPEWGYEIKDEKGNVCAELTIYANKDVSLELEWDGEKLIPDSTDSYIRTAENGESKCSIQLSAGMSTTIPLFKVNPDKVYDNKTKAISLNASKYTVTEDPADDTAEADETAEIAETEEVSA